MKGIEEPKALREARAALARFHGYLARCRKDLAHKTSRSIERVSDVVGVEDLDTKGMTAAPGTVLGDGSVKVPTVSKRDRKNMLDAGWAMTESLVRYKCAGAGKMMVRVNPAYTSRHCRGLLRLKTLHWSVFCPSGTAYEVFGVQARREGQPRGQGVHLPRVWPHDGRGRERGVERAGTGHRGVGGGGEAEGHQDGTEDSGGKRRGCAWRAP